MLYRLRDLGVCKFQIKLQQVSGSPIQTTSSEETTLQVQIDMVSGLILSQIQLDLLLIQTSAQKTQLSVNSLIMSPTQMSDMVFVYSMCSYQGPSLVCHLRQTPRTRLTLTGRIHLFSLYLETIQGIRIREMERSLWILAGSDSKTSRLQIIYWLE